MRLIDADELLKRALDYFVEEYQGTEEEFERTELKELVDDSQTVDAVPVVRCKDCKHHYFHELLKQDYCEIPNMQFGEIDPNGYCSRGRRIKSNVCDKK